MGKYILKRIVQIIVIIFLVSIFSFALTYLMPGDPVYAVLGNDITQEQYDIQFEKMGLDKPIIVRYFDWLGKYLQGDWGTSFKFRAPVKDIIAQRLPVTLYIGMISMVVSVILGILFGIISAVKRGKAIDNFITILANIGAVVPVFWLGVLGVYLFSMTLHWLPSYGFTMPNVDFVLSLRQTILPVLSLSVLTIAVTTRQMRSSLLEVINQDFIRTAKAIGLSRNEAVTRHGLKNAMIPVVTMVGLAFRNVIAGSASVEVILSIPGMGQLMVNSVLAKDVAVVQAGVVFIAIVVCITNLIIDISYGLLDPRIRVQ